MNMALTIATIAVIVIAHIAAWRLDRRLKRASLTRFDFEQHGRAKANAAWRDAA